MADGETFELRKDLSTGSNKLPMSKAQLEEKFHDCAALMIERAGRRRSSPSSTRCPAAHLLTTSGRCSGKPKPSLRRCLLPLPSAAHVDLPFSRGMVARTATLRQFRQSFATERAAAPRPRVWSKYR